MTKTRNRPENGLANNWNALLGIEIHCIMNILPEANLFQAIIKPNL